MVTEVIRLRARPRGRRRVTIRYETAADRPAEPPWHGGRVKIEDLPAFKARWGLAVVGSEWPEGAPCPTLYLRDRARPGR